MFYEFISSSTDVSRANKQLDEQLHLWRNRKLDALPYVYLDAQANKKLRSSMWQ
ncbi:MAG: transposase [Desulfocapsa sp.]|nr:transposase [Desulfocapsa sp.]